MSKMEEISSLSIFDKTVLIRYPIRDTLIIWGFTFNNAMNRTPFNVQSKL